MTEKTTKSTKKVKTQTKHHGDGITYAKPDMYKCQLCNRRLNRDQMMNGFCEDE